MEIAITFQGTAITALSAILTYLAGKNGRWMKEANERVERLIVEEARLTREMIKEISGKFDRQGERADRLVMEEARLSREFTGSLIKEMSDHFGQLVVARAK